MCARNCLPPIINQTLKFHIEKIIHFLEGSRDLAPLYPRQLKEEGGWIGNEQHGPLPQILPCNSMFKPARNRLQVQGPRYTFSGQLDL